MYDSLFSPEFSRISPIANSVNVVDFYRILQIVQIYIKPWLLFIELAALLLCDSQVTPHLLRDMWDGHYDANGTIKNLGPGPTLSPFCPMLCGRHISLLANIFRPCPHFASPLAKYPSLHHKRGLWCSPASGRHFVQGRFIHLLKHFCITDGWTDHIVEDREAFS